MEKRIDIYEGDISKLVKKMGKTEEVLKVLIENVDKDMESYFWVSVENFQRFEEINDVQDWGLNPTIGS